MNHITGNIQEEKLLVNRVLGGDTRAFEHIIKQSENIIAHIVFKMIANAEDRKDIVQDIYLKAYKKLSSFKFESKLSTWIARIAYNTCTDHLRKAKLLFPAELPDENLSDTTVMETTDYKVLGSLLHEEIQKLPPVLRVIITMFHTVGMTYEELSAITGMPLGTVKSYLFRARMALKNKLLMEYKKEDLL